MTLDEFLLARSAEDEALAEACVALGVDVGDLASWVEMGGDDTDAAKALFGRFSPERVLAECDAMRQIVDMHQQAEIAYAVVRLRDEDAHSTTSWTLSGVASALKMVTQTLALPYADHPDYDPAWRPE